MFTCIICHFDAELDDVVVKQGPAGCVCLRCYERETDTFKPMPKRLRREAIAVAGPA